MKRQNLPHDHCHAHIDPNSGDRRVSIAIWANGLFAVTKIARGILSGSLALIAHALRDFSDMASLLIAFVARSIARRQIKQVEQRMKRLEALRTELKRMVHECSGGRTADRRVLDVLRDHSECLTEHDEIGA